MIETAREFQKPDPLGKLVEFKVADGMKLPFADGIFDVVFSGGSTAFIDDKERAIREYKRVLKSWGFVADINFFYKKQAPKGLISELNNLMKINIQQWDENYWLDIYEKCGLEKYFVYKNSVKTTTAEEIKKYCSIMTDNLTIPEQARSALLKRLVPIMTLFSENNKYLNYGVFIYRKRPIEEQISLFDA